MPKRAADTIVLDTIGKLYAHATGSAAIASFASASSTCRCRG
jgi:hypothetical protein